MFTILDYSSALEYSIIRRYTNIVYYYYYYYYLETSHEAAAMVWATLCVYFLYVISHPITNKFLIRL